MLYPVQDIRWCGPTAVAALTGKTYNECLIRLAQMKQTKPGDVEGVWQEESLILLWELGYANRPIDLVKRYAHEVKTGVTFPRFIRERTPMERAQPMLVRMSRPAHVLAVYQNYVVGTETHGSVIPVDAYPCPKRIVDAAWTITPSA